jgi:hypothetical protein
LGGSAKAAPAPYNVLINPGAETGGFDRLESVADGL